jgi:hypothetical protein
MRFLLYLITVIAVVLSVTTACSKKSHDPVPDASFYGKWVLASSSSPNLARIHSPALGSVLSLDANGRYEISSQGSLLDSGTFILSRDTLSPSVNLLIFNNQEYFEYGLLDHKNAFTVNIHGDRLWLTFLTTMELLTTPVLQFQKQ